MNQTQVASDSLGHDHQTQVSAESLDYGHYVFLDMDGHHLSMHHRSHSQAISTRRKKTCATPTPSESCAMSTPPCPLTNRDIASSISESLDSPATMVFRILLAVGVWFDVIKKRGVWFDLIATTKKRSLGRFDGSLAWTNRAGWWVLGLICVVPACPIEGWKARGPRGGDNPTQ